MKKSLEEHAARFNEMASDYDESRSPEYNECTSLVVEHAAPADDVVLDLGCGTGAIALALAPAARRVIGRDISEEMLTHAREKAANMGLGMCEFGYGSFREPDVNEPIDIVTSNFAMHHLSDREKRDAIDVIAEMRPNRFVLGDVMFFGPPDPTEPFYNPAVDDPATVGLLADAMTDAGFSLTAVAPVHEQVGVLVAERSE